MAAEAVQQPWHKPRFGVPEAWDDPQLAVLPRSHRQRMRMIQGEVGVPVSVDEQNRRRRDPAGDVERGRRDHRPDFGHQPYAERVPGDAAAGGGLREPAQAPHRRSVTDVPAARRAHADDGVNRVAHGVPAHAVPAAGEGRVAEHRSGPHRPTDGDDVQVTKPPGFPHGRVHIQNLQIAEGAHARGLAVTPQIRGEHAGIGPDAVADRPDRGFVTKTGKTVDDDNPKIKTTIGGRTNTAAMGRGEDLTVRGGENPEDGMSGVGHSAILPTGRCSFHAHDGRGTRGAGRKVSVGRRCPNIATEPWRSRLERRPVAHQRPRTIRGVLSLTRAPDSHRSRRPTRGQRAPGRTTSGRRRGGRAPGTRRRPRPVPPPAHNRAHHSPARARHRGWAGRGVSRLGRR